MQNLPAEVLDLILGYFDSYADKQALRNLRRTCQTLSNAAAIHLFKTMYVWLERDSLQKLLRCAEHPVVSQCITQVTIGSGRLNPYKFSDFLPEGRERSVPLMWGARDIKELYHWASSCPPYGYFEGRILRAKLLVGHLEYQKRMEKDGLDLALLVRAMKRLPKLSALAFEYDHRPADYRALYWEGFSVDNPGLEWRRHVLQVGLQALTEAGCKPRTISLNIQRKSGGYKRVPEAHSEGDHLDGGDSNVDRPDDGYSDGSHWDNDDSYDEREYTPPWAFNDLDLLIPDTRLCALVQHLQVFHYDKMMKMDWGSYYLPPGGALGHFLEKAQQLEEISLTAFDRYHFPNIFGQAVFRRLRKVSFIDAWVNMGHLVDWLLAHSASLEDIDLMGVILAEGRWDTFLDLMRTKSWPCLSSIGLVEVITDNSGWGWEYGPGPLVSYVRKETEGNPYHVYHPGWFPELFESV